MPTLTHPLLLLVARATERDLVLYIECLKTENRILRSKLPKRINVTPAERARLVKRRILGELKKLRVQNVSRSAIARILQENGFDPGPQRGRGTWHDFIQRHVKTLWAADFFAQTVWTLRGPVTYYVLFFLHGESRRTVEAPRVPGRAGGLGSNLRQNPEAGRQGSLCYRYTSCPPPGGGNAATRFLRQALIQPQLLPDDIS